jgi:hypothetical protein
MMQQMMSRYGGHNFLLGKGKASYQDLPEDQSLDNLLDNYAPEIIPNHYYVSTYDAQPDWMASYTTLPDIPESRRAVKVGTIYHVFNELLMQYPIEVSTDIYFTDLHYPNVYIAYIKTDGRDLDEFIPNYLKCYDLTLILFIRRKEVDEVKLRKNRANLLKMLVLNLYKMGATGDSYIKFTPSKTPLGKNLPDDIDSMLKDTLEDMDGDNALAASLKALQRIKL